jgi:DNA-binding NarL/FixJ family response regulator
MKFTRLQIMEMVKDGFLNKKSVTHFDVCKALAEGKTQNQVAEEKDIRETKTIRVIKLHKCKYCDT